ncbi:MAG: glutamate-5-semialdehyde dehydrogenase, partial [Ruminococcus sp.]
MNYAETLGVKARNAQTAINSADTALKNKALNAVAESLLSNTEYIIQQNLTDLENAKANGMSVSMQDRLKLTPERIKGMADGVLKIAELTDPVGQIIEGYTRPNGLQIIKTRVPLGVIGIIFESRPNVTVDASALCLKSGNAVILRGGKEAINSNKCLCGIMRDAVEKAGLPADIIQLVEDTSRETASDMMKLNGYIDVLIPRGGAGLINAVMKQATVPVIQTGVGNCHVYVDESADIEMAVDIADNAKTQRPSVCNAIESLLVHKNIADEFLKKISERYKKHSVEIYGDSATKSILGDDILNATETEYATEFNDYKIAVKVVENIDEAIAHIRKYGT